MPPVLIGLAIFALCAALLPTRWGVRIWAAAAMSAGTWWLLLPKASVLSHSTLDGLGEGLILSFLAAALVGVAVRALLPSQPPGDVENRALRRADILLSALAGVCAGFLLVLALALAMRGLPGGLPLHIAVSVLSVATAIWILFKGSGLIRPASIAAFSVLAIKAMLGGLDHPALIESRAASVSRDLPHCLRAVDRLATPEDTMLLTLPRGQPGAPGLVLTVMAAEGPRHYRWSYRAGRFIRYGSYRYGGCP